MSYKIGTQLKCRESGETFTVYNSSASVTHYKGTTGDGDVETSEVLAVFEVIETPASALDTQVGGDYQPWEVLRHWLTPEEFRGYMKGTAIAYLAREQDKGGTLDIKKACHTLQGLLELGAE